MLRKSLILATLLLSVFFVAFGTDLGSSFGAFFQNISSRPGANTTTYSLSNGLVGHWTFDGKDTAWNSNTTQDKSGQGNTGTMTSMSTTTSPVPGKLGQALNFDGLNDYVGVGDPGSGILDFGDTADFTITGWFYRDTETTDDLIISKNTTCVSATIGYCIGINASQDLLYLVLGDGTDTYFVGSQTVFTTPGWYHFAAVWDQDSAANTEIYINGVDNDAGDTGTIGNIGDLSNALPVRIGDDVGGNGPFDGTLDDIRVYNRALSADEVKQLYLQGSSLKQSITPRKGSGTPSYTLEGGLVGHWTFDGKDTLWNKNQTNDLSGQGNTGTITSMSTTSSPVPGKLGQGMKFDGVDDAINLGSGASYSNFAGNVSAAAWIKTSTDGRIILNYQNGNPLIYVEVGATTAGGTANKFVVYLRTDAGSTNVFSGNITITDNLWHHVAFARDTVAQEVKLYVDGVLDTTGAYTDTGPINTAGGGGHSLSPLGSFQFVGILDDVRVYNRALSADEVKQLYLQGSSLKQSITPRKGSAPPSHTLDGGLVGHWTFDGKDTLWNKNQTNDVSGQGNTGTMTSMSTTTSPTPGKLGQGFNFDGVDDYVSIPDDTDIDFAFNQDFAVSFWVKDGGGNSDFDALVEKWDGAGGYPYVLRYHSTFGAFFARYDGTNNPNITSSVVINDGVWHHIVAQKSGSTLSIYNDGKFENSTTDTTTGVTTNNSLLYLGSRGGSGQFYNGTIDDVRVYNRALSADEVKQLYLMGR